MRIAFVVGPFPALSETFILNQITGLIDRGHEVDIYSFYQGNTAKMHPDVEKYHLLDRTYYMRLRVPDNFFLRVLKLLKLLSANGYKHPLVWLSLLNVFKYGKQAASLRLLYQVMPLLGKGAYDIVHCQFGTLSLLAMPFFHLNVLKGKLITSFRGYDISEYLRQYGDDVYKELFSVGDFFLPNCEYFQHRLLKLGCHEKKIAVHRSGIDCSRFVFTPRQLHPDGIVRIVTTGRLTEKKGIEYSIRAVAKLAKINRNIEYNIIGDGTLKQDLQQLIQDLDVSDIVKLLGWKQQQELIEILNNSHIFIAPSVTASNGNQDAPVNVLKEAMAMGLPVISTYHGGIPELVENGVSGFLVPERDPDAIAEKLNYLISHPQVWPEMGRAGRAFVEQHYDTTKLNDELVAIYQQLLSTDFNAPQQGSPELLVSPKYT